MITTEEMKKYIKDEYGLDFKYEDYGKEKWLKLKVKKNEYTLHCDYANHPLEKIKCWSIYMDHMDYSTWSGHGSAIIENGYGTIDYIMELWGFKKKNQLSLF